MSRSPASKTASALATPAGPGGVQRLRPIDRLLTRLYHRLGGRYILLYLLFDFASVVAMSAIAITVGSKYFPVTDEQFIVSILVVTGFVHMALWVAKVWIYRDAAPLIAWIRRRANPADAPLAWDAGLQLPRRFVVRSGLVAGPLGVVPAALLVGAEFGLPPYGLLIFAAVALLVGAGYICALHLLAVECALRPVMRELAPLVPDASAPVSPMVSLRVKLLLVTPIIALSTAIFASAFGAHGSSEVTELARDVLIAAAWTGTAGLLLALLLAGSVLSPVKELGLAAERVGRGEFASPAAILSADELGQLTRSFNEAMRGLEQRELLRSALGSYVDPAIAERVAAEGSLIRGEAVDVTVMFVDIVGFTALAEQAIPEEVVSDLNDFFGVVIPAIERHGGHANKLLGDGLMAVFGAPRELENHATCALAAAREIQAGLLDRYEEQLQAGIGLNSGTVVVGSMGGGAKLDYTIIGDVVNVAARVEAHTRQTRDKILITEQTCQLLPAEEELVRRDAVALKGRSGTVQLYAIAQPTAATGPIIPLRSG